MMMLWLVGLVRKSIVINLPLAVAWFVPYNTIFTFNHSICNGLNTLQGDEDAHFSMSSNTTIYVVAAAQLIPFRLDYLIVVAVEEDEKNFALTNINGNDRMMMLSVSFFVVSEFSCVLLGSEIYLANCHNSKSYIRKLSTQS